MTDLEVYYASREISRQREFWIAVSEFLILATLLIEWQLFIAVLKGLGL
jgi:hypothetical protein